MRKWVSALLSAVIMVTFSNVVHANNDQPFAIHPRFIGAESFSEGLAAVQDQDTGNWGVINKSGQYVTEAKYSWVYPFNDGMASVSVQQKMGFVNKNGVEVVKPQYDSTGLFSEGLAWVSMDKLIGFIDKSGKFVVKPQYYEVRDLIEGLAWVRKSGEKWGAIDQSGKYVIKPIYDGVYNFSDGLAHVSREGKKGFVNKSGKEIFLYEAGTWYDYKEGFAWSYRANDKWGMIDKTGKLVIKALYDVKRTSDYALGFKEGRALFSKDGKWGFIDHTGREVIPAQFKDARDFSDGKAKVLYNGTVSFIDKSGKIIASTPYKSLGNVSDYKEDLVLVSTVPTYSVNYGNDSFGFLDTSGKQVYSAAFDGARDFSDGLAAVRIGKLWGYIPHPFNDKPSSWAKSEVDAAINSNLVPLNTRYWYERNINRADFSRLVMNLLTVKTGKSIDTLLSEQGKKVSVYESPFKDRNDANILAANVLGIVNGKSEDKFDPYGDITRQEAAVILTKTAQILDITGSSSTITYSDSKDIASWAREAVAFISSSEDSTNQTKVMGSTGDNKFSPLAKYTRQQAFITIKRLFYASM